MSTDRRNPDRTSSPIVASRRAMMQGALGAGTLASLSAMGVRPALGQEAETCGNLPAHPEWTFTFVNHVTTNPFFVPTQYGIEDACSLLGCSYQWTGSQKSVSSEMVNAMNTAIAGGTDGIAVALVNQTAFNAPTERALEQGIPVFSYNADAPENNRLAYIGQDLYLAGRALGERIVDLVDEGEVVGFIATPGQLNIQPRMDGAADAIKESGKDINLSEIASGPTVNEEVSRVDSYYVGHKDVKAMFAVDAGSTMAVAKTMEKYDLHEQGVRGGGFDLLPNTLDGIANGHLDFTIDQQPYLQGFYTVMELFMFKMSGGLAGPANINTGLKFVTQENVESYRETKSRYEGDSEEQKLLERSGPIVAG